MFLNCCKKAFSTAISDQNSLKTADPDADQI